MRGYLTAPASPATARSQDQECLTVTLMILTLPGRPISGSGSFCKGAACFPPPELGAQQPSRLKSCLSSSGTKGLTELTTDCHLDLSRLGDMQKRITFSCFMNTAHKQISLQTESSKPYYLRNIKHLHRFYMLPGSVGEEMQKEPSD